MKKSQILIVRLVDGRNPLFRKWGKQVSLSNVFLSITFFRNRKLCYGFSFGPTDKDGEIVVSYNDVDEKRLSSLALQPWDYKTLVDELDNRIFISIPTAPELASAYETNKTFNRGIPDRDAAQWLTANNGKIRSEGLFVTLQGDSTTCVLKCYPRGA